VEKYTRIGALPRVSTRLEKLRPQWERGWGKKAAKRPSGFRGGRFRRRTQSRHEVGNGPRDATVSHEIRSRNTTNEEEKKIHRSGSRESKSCKSLRKGWETQNHLTTRENRAAIPKNSQKLSGAQKRADTEGHRKDMLARHKKKGEKEKVKKKEDRNE